MDGSSLIYKCFYGLVKTDEDLEDPRLKATFFRMLKDKLTKWRERENYSYAMVAFDVDRKSFRNDIISDYKMQRKDMPEQLASWLPEIDNQLETIGLRTIYAPKNFEADDLIGTVSKRLGGCDFKVDIFTTDGDLLQLVDHLVSVYKVKNGFELEKHDHHSFQSLNEGLLPCQIPLYKALSGDSADNYPGVPGIGKINAVKLIQTYKTVDRLIESLEELKSGKIRESLLANKDLLFKCLKIAEIRTNIKINYSLSDFALKN
ncbi:5'-3' exonuclease [Candidatus Mycoplasma haematolamae str. Purdue]|uniref:5'-3' exonuclease n=1 Tax=Mycoplasma haematolamae (strain Purdue) TaxID=1212765 RepID=I7CEP7_MYCHA|nr:5'-3' exonuclease [Candidatus Mycoplasma haematolamae str. Purdue]